MPDILSALAIPAGPIPSGMYLRGYLHATQVSVSDQGGHTQILLRVDHQIHPYITEIMARRGYRDLCDMILDLIVEAYRVGKESK